MFSVYRVYEVCGYGETLVASFETEAEAEAYMAQLIAEDIKFYGGQCDEYYVEEV